MFKKTLALTMIFAMIISVCGNLTYANSGTLPEIQEFTSDTLGLAAGGADASNIGISLAQNGANSYGKIDVTPKSTAITAATYVNYNLTGKGITAENYETITIESKMKFSSSAQTNISMIAFQKAEVGSSGFTFSDTMSVSDGMATINGKSFAYDMDDDVNNPDFAKGWQTLWFQVNLRTKAMRLYWNNQNNYVDLNVPATAFDGMHVLRFSPTTAANDTEHNIIYLDYMKITEGAPTNIPVDSPDGSMLLNRTFNKNATGMDAAYGATATWGFQQGGYAKITASANNLCAGVTINNLNINSDNYANKKVTVESRVKISTAGTIQIQSHGTGPTGSTFPIASSSGATGGNIVLHNIPGKNASYQMDANPASPDFDIGWKTVWLEFDFATNNVRIYWGDKMTYADSAVSLSKSSFGSIRGFRFLLSSGSIMYADYIKIYTGKAQVPDLPSGYVLHNQEFDNAAALGFTAPAGTSVTQQVDGAKKYAKIQTTAVPATNIYVPYNIMNLGISKDLYPGKITIETKVKFSTKGFMQLGAHGLNAQNYRVAATINTDNGTAALITGSAPYPATTYSTDTDADNPDFYNGWQTVWLEIDFGTNKTIVYWGSADVNATFDNADLGILQWLRIGFGVTSGAKETMYMDYFKVYTGSAINVPINRVALEDNFQGYAPGQDLSGIGLFRAPISNVSATAVVDPANTNNQVLKLQSTTIEGGSNIDLKLAQTVGKQVRVRFRAMVDNVTPYRNFPQFLSSTGEAIKTIPLSGGNIWEDLNSSAPFTTMQNGEWKTFEYFFDQTVVGGRYKVFINDNPIANYEGTLGSTNNELAIIRFAFAQETSNIYLDDLFVGKLDEWVSPTEQMLNGLFEAIADPGVSEYTIPEGQYLLHNSIKLENLDNFTIKGEEGKSVELIFSGDINGLWLVNCRNSSVKNVKIDYMVPSFSQGSITNITKVNSSNYTLKVLIDENDGAGHSYDVPDSTDSRWLSQTRGIYFNAATKKEITSNANDAIKTITAGATAREIVVGMGPITATTPLKAGDKMAFIRRSGGTALYQTGGENNLFEDISIYSSWGFGISDGYGNGGNRYNRVTIGARPGTNRLLATSADGFHSYNIKNGPIITNCDFANTADDILNIHSFYSIVTKNVDGTLTIVSPFGVDFTDSSSLTFYDFMSLNRIGTFDLAAVIPVTGEEKAQAREALDNATVKAAVGIAPNGSGIRDIPISVYGVSKVTPKEEGAFDNIPVYTLLESSDIASGKGAVIKNNKFHDGHVRGLLIRPSDALIEGNELYDINGPAVQVATDRYFLEGNPGANIVIKNNTVYRTNRAPEFLSGAVGAIFVTGTPFTDNNTVSANYNVENIAIDGNILTNNGGAGIFATNLNGGRIDNNEIVNPFVTGAITATNLTLNPLPNYGIYVVNSQNVTFNGNQAIEQSASNMADKIYYNNATVSTDGRAWAELKTVDDTVRVVFKNNSVNTTSYDGDIYVQYNDGNIRVFPLPAINGEIIVSLVDGYEKILVWDKQMKPYSKKFTK